MTRRDFIKAAGLGAALAAAPRGRPAGDGESGRPNILWITSEDNGPFLGCYGDALAATPSLDRLASQGVLFENAFAGAPVCAPARCTIITGMNACSLGTQHMRSSNPVPGFVEFFPQSLRAAGYYCTNNAKEDYNTPKPEGVWDESSRKAHYGKRKPGQPFFAVFNITVSHESGIHKSAAELRHDPEEMVLPPYHPDTPAIRHDWAQYYDKVEAMDARVGELLRELDAAGLAEDTIVFYFSDHGGVLARSKRFLYDSGTHVPLIVRFPEKYRHLAPAAPGSRTSRLVSFVDLAPTVLGLAGVGVPGHMQGAAFLGPRAGEPREFVHLFRGRMDERYDMMRAVRDERFKYIRNYMPHRIYGQHLEYLWRAPSTRSWEQAFREGRCNAAQSAFWGPKPAEELYDTKADPHEVHNLTADREYAEVLERMRRANAEWVRAIHDTGFMPEGEQLDRCRDGTPYELVRKEGFPLERVIATAEAASSRDPDAFPLLKARLEDPESCVRYWAATGCAVLGTRAERAAVWLIGLLEDPSADVRIAAAEALCGMERCELAVPALVNELENPNPRAALHAVNVLAVLGEKARPALDALKKLLEESEDNYIQRAAGRTVAVLDEHDGS